jgi:recombinational DNA repair ATPase RecF
MSHRTWIKRLELKNYRCFAHLTIDFDERLTVLYSGPRKSDSGLS